MYIGQIGTTPWLKASWLKSAGFSQISTKVSAAVQREQAQQQSEAVNRDRLELSASYLCFPNRLKVLETPEAVQAESNLDLSADLRPASEKEQYTEDDALMKQYMKQYRLDFIKDGDTFVLDTSRPVKLMTEGQVSQESLEAFRARLEKEGLGDEIDWRGVQEDLIHMDVRFDNAQSFERKADYLASRYAVLKDRIHTQYTGEKLEQQMQILDTLYTSAKKEMADSYAENIGGFYEELGQSKVAGDMKESVLAVIDRKMEEYTAYLAENDIYADITDPKQQWLKQDDGYMAARLRECAAVSSAGASSTGSEAVQVPYSADDLAFAALCAKGFSEQIKNPQWDTSEIKASDADLGEYLAGQYQSRGDMMEQAGISDRMSDIVKDSFEPFIDKFLDALDKKIDQNRERVAKKPRMSGFIRTEYINRNEVCRAFVMFQ